MCFTALNMTIVFCFHLSQLFRCAQQLGLEPFVERSELRVKRHN